MSKSIKPISIILADDHEIFRAGLKKLIQESPRFLVAGEASNGRELISLLEAAPCDLLILDISMPELDGLEALEQIHKRFPAILTLVLSMHANPAYLKRSVARGAAGYVLKEDAFDRLIWAIDEVLAGRKAYSRSITDRALDNLFFQDDPEHQSADILTQRERQILALVAGGRTSRQIAEELKLSVRTVENHRARMMEKLGIHNSAALIKFALSARLV